MGLCMSPTVGGFIDLSSEGEHLTSGAVVSPFVPVSTAFSSCLCSLPSKQTCRDCLVPSEAPRLEKCLGTLSLVLLGR